MNTKRHTFQRTAAAIALVGSFTLAHAADDVLWTWDTPDALGSWGTAWGQAQTSQDPTQDNTGNGGGSVHVISDFANPANPDDNQNVITVMGNHGGWLWNGDVRVDLTEFDSLEFDLKWDTANATVPISDFNTTGGDNGLAVLSARYDTDWRWHVTLAHVLIPEEAADAWVHISVPIDPITPDLDRSAGLMFKKWVPKEVADAGGVAAFWIDNVHLIASDVPIPPPTLAISSEATPGLNLITLAGSEWQRQGIRTVGDNFSWVGSGSPTTYEFTIRDVPDVEFAQFQTHIFLVPRDPRSGAGPDWGQPDVVFFDMRVLDDGAFSATFRYKIDMPDSNSFMFGGEGELGSVTSSTAVGSWGLTFNDDKNITIFSPEASADLVLPDAAVAKFNDALTVYFGCQPNATERVGQKTVLAQARIEGAAGGTDITDSFSGPLDTDTWELAAENPAGIMILDEDVAFWVSWSLPDTGYGLQAATDVVSADWNPYAGASAVLPTGPTKSVLIAKSGLPDAHMGYWRLAKRHFTKLLVLLPGETAAPGTATGKTGTPDPVPLFEAINVTVNAVAQDWALMSDVTDNVAFTSTDASAFLPEETTLVNGTATVEVIFFTEGTQTITASDVTNPEIESGTSTEVTPSQ